ncbi:hypothetical protein FM037_03110 [Shewanella psychropiezotolerans]|uniref:Uncharacterized protein n=1 Tax=Shewanella psychropiezotolerans TaxID=2593655 RepID=A0ABX5WW69_9GAMM|nr:hypothetical protein [Shewanella psychropiezotolerans]QDO82417.1 hypothetical protein FM037_03110 [Shewanella psychropiezotolerans]
MSYRNEFGSNFDLGFNLNDFPYLKDKSWHNDVCPSFYFNVGTKYYVLWIDYSELAKRDGSNDRYLVQEATNEGDEKHPEIYSSDGNIIFEGELFTDLNQFLNNITSLQDPNVS